MKSNHDVKLFFILAKGKVSMESAVVIGAIAEEASKLEPNNKTPIIHLQNDNHSCIIHRSGTVTGAIFKNVHNL